MLKGKSVIVTGSTSGIGLGIARAFAAQGCNVMLNGFGDAVQIEKLRAGLAAEHKVTVLYSSADMAKPLEIAAMVDQVASRFSSVDGLVNKQIDDQSKAHNIAREEVIDKVILERQPSKEFVKVEEVAALAVFLAGDSAASITGAAYSIDGGWTAQ